MKFNSSFIIAFLLSNAISAYTCKADIRLQNKAILLYANLEYSLGKAKSIRNLKVCFCRKCFFEIEGGAMMNAVFDRKKQTILLRPQSKSVLKHEVIHVYLEHRLGPLPARWSEYLTRSLLLINDTEDLAFQKLSANHIKKLLARNRQVISSRDLVIALNILLLSSEELQALNLSP